MKNVAYVFLMMSFVFFVPVEAMKRSPKEIEILQKAITKATACRQAQEKQTQENKDVQVVANQLTENGARQPIVNVGTFTQNTFISPVAEMYQVSQQTQQTGIYRCGWIVGNQNSGMICNASFATKETLHSHTDSFHIKQGDKMCHWVGCAGNNKKNDTGEFSSVGALNTHVKHHHTIQPAPLLCFYCGGYFTKKGNLAIHIEAAHAGSSLAINAIVMDAIVMDGKDASQETKNSNVPQILPTREIIIID